MPRQLEDCYAFLPFLTESLFDIAEVAGAQWRGCVCLPPRVRWQEKNTALSLLYGLRTSPVML